MRSPSRALADLNDTAGTDAADVIRNFKRARGRELCAADHQAIAAFERITAQEPYGVSQFNATLDRLEGPVPKDVNVRQSGMFVVNVVDLDAMLEGRVSPQRAQELAAGAVEAELVPDDPEAAPRG